MPQLRGGEEALEARVEHHGWLARGGEAGGEQQPDHAVLRSAA